MDRKWSCPHCNLRFSRRWNTERHVATQHSGLANISKSPPGNSGLYYKSARVSHRLERKKTQDSEAELDDLFFPGFSNMDKFLQRWNEFNLNRPQFGSPSTAETNSLQLQLNSVYNELSYLKSNFWLVPKDQILGISGHFCKRCQSFSFHPVRNPGYDMTAECMHRCDEEKVRGIKLVSIRPSDVDSVDDFFARQLLNTIKNSMPETRYLKSLDFSDFFTHFAHSYNEDIAKGLMGIPDRFCLYKPKYPDCPSWLTRAMRNLNKKIVVDENEVIDFLKRVKSTYGIFEVEYWTIRKFFFLSLVPRYREPNRFNIQEHLDSAKDNRDAW